MQIRQLGPTDVEVARNVTVALKPGSAVARVDPNCLAAFLADRRNVPLTRLRQSSPVALLLAYVLKRIDGERPRVLLSEIDVAPSHRERGVGRPLVDALMDLSRDTSAGKACVSTAGSNRAAVALYEAAGFVASVANDDVIFVFGSQSPK